MMGECQGHIAGEHARWEVWPSLENTTCHTKYLDGIKDVLQVNFNLLSGKVNTDVIHLNDDIKHEEI